METFVGQQSSVVGIVAGGDYFGGKAMAGPMQIYLYVHESREKKTLHPAIG